MTYLSCTKLALPFAVLVTRFFVHWRPYFPACISAALCLPGLPKLPSAKPNPEIARSCSFSMLVLWLSSIPPWTKAFSLTSSSTQPQLQHWLGNKSREFEEAHHSLFILRVRIRRRRVCYRLCYCLLLVLLAPHLVLISLFIHPSLPCPNSPSLCAGDCSPPTVKE